ncbi:hypothetical protein KDL29_06115 [bacterium]|nr:hypothetical protein [bacterium]
MRLVGSGTAWSVAVLIVLAACCLLPSCSGRQPDMSAPAQQVDLTPGPEPAAPVADGLPQLASLPDAQHSASYLGQGWFPVPILEQGVLIAASPGVSSAAQGVVINAAGGQSAWAVFGIYGFDGDSFPAALACELTTLSGDYALAASRYLDGRWEVAGPFTDDAQFEYAYAGGGADPRNLLSGRGCHYVAVIASPGSSLELSGLQLAVDGGQDGPAAVSFPQGIRSSLGVQLVWQASADGRNPDFEGYIVERADWPGTTFAAVSEPLHGLDWLDTDLQEDRHYRYRIRSFDVAGNSSSGPYSTVLGSFDNLPPVCVMDIPTGPLYGAQQVTIDLSRSFDRDNDSFTDYTLLFGNDPFDIGVGPLSNTDGAFSVLLQPGCYHVIGVVTAGANIGTCVSELKIYPQWENEAQLIASAPPVAPVLGSPSGTYLPAINGVATFGLEPVLPGLGLLLQPADSPARLLRIVPPRFGIDGISEATQWNGLAICAAVDGSNAYIAYTDGENFDWLEVGRGFVKGSRLDLVVPASSPPYLCFIEENFMPSSRLLAYASIGSSTPLELVPVFEGDYPFDVEWNAAQQGFDILYGQPGATRLRRCDASGNMLLERTIAFTTPQKLELEIDPATGNPVILWRSSGGTAIYTQYDNDSDSFLPGEPVDPLLLASLGEQLALAGGLPVVFMGSPGQPAGLYHRTGGSWQRMAADWSPLSGTDGSLAARPDGTLRVLDSDDAMTSWLVDIMPGATQSVVDSLPPTGRQGMDLNAVAGSDGLHAIWCADGESRHYRNPEDGSGWQPVNLLDACQSQDLMADQSGSVLLSTRVDNASFLLKWNGADWDAIWFTLSNLDQSNPWMCMQSNSPAPQWLYLEDDLPDDRLHYVTDYGTGLQESTSSIYPDQVMEGAGVYSGNFMVSIVALGNGSYRDGRIGVLNKPHNSVDVLLNASANIPDEASGLQGRQLDACMGKHSSGNVQTVFYSSVSAFQQDATRLCGFSYNGDFSLQEQAQFRFAFGNRDWQRLRTVSAVQAWGLTCVGLIDQAFADGAKLEWDDFGDWEQLSLPPVDFARSNMHELVVGNDGRWHMLFHDLQDGGIYVISTT